MLLALLSALSFSAFANELNENLQFLQPLMEEQWVGGFVGSESSDIQITLRFEQILGGSTVRYVREVEGVDFSGLTLLYWHPGRKQACFTSLNTRGIVGEGTVLAEGGTIVLQGMSYWPDKTTEFQTTLEIDSQGTLRDTFRRMDAGEWVMGHIQEFVGEK